MLDGEFLMPESRINFVSEYEYRGEVYRHFQKKDQYPIDFWTYPARESEKGVLNQPMLFMPESRHNLILDFENGLGEAFSHFRKKDFGQYPIDLKSMDQGSDRKGFQNDQYKFKSDANGTIIQNWLEMNTYGTVLFGTNPYLTVKYKNSQFGAIGYSTINSKYTFETNPEFKANVGPSAKLKIKNLDLDVKVEDLSELFSEFGPLKRIYVNKDRYGKSLGTANVYFENKNHAISAEKKYNGFVFFEKPMNIHIPEPKLITPNNFEDNGKHSSDFQTIEMVEEPEIMQKKPWYNVHTQPIFTLSGQLHENRTIINPMCLNSLNRGQMSIR